MRIDKHPIIDYERKGRVVAISVNGNEIEAIEGEPIAAAILASGIKVFRRTPKLNSPRGVYCAIGRCTDCVMKVNGVPSIRTCITPVESGMIIETQENVHE